MRDRASSEPEVSSEPARLREAERLLARMQGEIGSGIGERVARLETGEKRFATKADVERAKIWIVTRTVAACGSVLLILRLISWIWSSVGT